MADNPQLRRRSAIDAQPGQRDELLRVLANYAQHPRRRARYDAVRGSGRRRATTNLVWAWEEFADEDALRGHFEHDFFRALQLELADLLASPWRCGR